MDFDRIIDRRGTGCMKWDQMEDRFGVSADDGIPMWVADMDFPSPQVVQDALRKMVDIGIYGYPSGADAYCEATRWWMDERHGWNLETGDVLIVDGLVNGTALCLDAFTEPGDGVVLMTPVYHAFHRVIRAAGRAVVQMPMPIEDGVHKLDIAGWDAAMTGGERMLVLCSPHNPGGRVWSRDELRAIADFARRHDLILISDEIHHDLVFPGRTHVPMAAACPDIADRLVTMTAASKTFNLAGGHTGSVIISDEALRTRFAARLAALGLSPNAFGLAMTTAAYSPEGAAWLDELIAYLDGNRRVFDAAIEALPGVRSMPLEATYLAWVDFSDTGMAPEEVTRRVARDARIAASPGPAFGRGGEDWLRFNFAMPRARVEEAGERLAHAFRDLQ